MYQYEWFDKSEFGREENSVAPIAFRTEIDWREVESVLLLEWQEHCHECAPPLCYQTCALFMERRDQKCRNVRYGIYRNPAFNGLYDFGADMRFRKWGKLETPLSHYSAAPEKIVKIDSINYSIVQKANFFSDLLTPLDKKRKLNGVLNLLRIKKIDALRDQNPTLFHEFVIECFSFQPEPFRLIVEARSGASNFRTSLHIAPGKNLLRLPFSEFNFVDGIPSGRLAIFPENDLEARMVFTWLDFVRYKVAPVIETKDAPPAEKLKCIAWDLDNTMWKGVFIESKPEDLVVNQAAVDLIRKLDERGILQTVVSKNTYEDVWPFLEKIGVAEYFLFPAINWGQKSTSLKKIAAALNINIDTFGVIDDSEFERHEIRTMLPMVRVYRDTEIGQISEYPELDVPVTEESRKRRSFYQVEQQRNQIADHFSGDYVAFLRDCQICLTIFTPVTENEVQRCYELVQRTNQLNLSTRRYDLTAFQSILSDSSYLKYAFECFDRFGTYGIVGFMIVKIVPDGLMIHDFVISCRVAQKLVENALVFWLAQKLVVSEKRFLTAEYIQTKKNAQILSVFEEIKFRKEDKGNGNWMLRLDIQEHMPENNIITVHEK
jgi:FkbH-like protein